MSSVSSSGQAVMKLCMLASAPALASRLTSHVKASPRACAVEIFSVLGPDPGLMTGQSYNYKINSY